MVTSALPVKKIMKDSYRNLQKFILEDHVHKDLKD